MGRILLVRHGETAWNAAGRLQGHTDIELNEAGRAQARSLAAAVERAGVAAIVTSDLARARQTGEIVAAALRLGAPSIEPALRERRFGVFEGLTRDECAARYPEAWRAWQAQTGSPPGGEERPAAVARLAGALGRIAAAAATGAGGGAGAGGETGIGTVLVVSHGGVMRLWLREVLGADVPLIQNGEAFVVELDERGRGGFRARRWDRAALP